jgi:probable rRNA maturation factor
MSGSSKIFSNQRGRLPKQEAIDLADHILKREGKKHPVNIIFAGDQFIKGLNEQFRMKNKPTDVLSFPADSELEILGEVYISIETARRQAEEYFVTLREEILRLVCHGVLHLCGYDHQDDSGSRLMKDKEGRYLKRLLSDD